MKKPVDIRKTETIGEVDANESRSTPIDTSPRFQHFIAFSHTLVPAGSNVMICAQSVMPFKPRRLVIPPSIAKDIVIYDLKVGKHSFMFNYQGVSGECFPPLPQDAADIETMLRLESMLVMEVDVLQPQQLMGIGVQNVTEHPVNFTAIMWGLTR